MLSCRSTFKTALTAPQSSGTKFGKNSARFLNYIFWYYLGEGNFLPCIFTFKVYALLQQQNSLSDIL
jgi:hypothetical protein